MKNCIVNNIKILRKKYRISEQELCKAMGISPATLRRKKKSAGDFKLSEIEKAARRLHTTPGQLLSDSFKSSRKNYLVEEV